MNQVDRLLWEVGQLQAGCAHVFELVEPVELRPSLMNGVALGHEEPGSEPIVRSRCSRCSLKRTESILLRCPQCLGEMTKGTLLGGGSRKQYFGREYIYYTVRIYGCIRCPFKHASDEWDQ